MKNIAIFIIFFTSVLINVQAQEVKPSSDTADKTVVNTLTIESKVTGSQEQPKVLYIMPWQGIAKPISIKDKKLQLAMPEFKPVNPKIFRKEVRDFAAAQTLTTAKKNEKNN